MFQPVTTEAIKTNKMQLSTFLKMYEVRKGLIFFHSNKPSAFLLTPLMNTM